VRWRTRRLSGEVTWFRNAIDDFIFRNPLMPSQIVAEYGSDFDAEGYPVVQFASADSVLTGVEAHADVRLTERFTLEGGLDYVRGTNRLLDAPLPRIPPLRVRGGLRYQRNAFQTGGEVVATADQDRVFGAETPTPGAAIAKLYGACSWETGPGVSTITVRLENVGNRRYWNHLSYIKDFVPEMGRSLRVIYGLEF